MTHRHKGSTASIPGESLGVHQTTTYAKVTEFDVTISIQQDIRRFHICARRERGGGVGRRKGREE